MGRADLRLARTGWDPAEVPLARRLCRLVWSEWTHTIGESDRARQAEEGFLHELQVTEGTSVPSPEQHAIRLEAERAERAKASSQLEKLRAGFEQAGDDVNVLWLKHERAVQRLLGKERGVDLEEEP